LRHPARVEDAREHRRRRARTTARAAPARRHRTGSVAAAARVMHPGAGMKRLRPWTTPTIVALLLATAAPALAGPTIIRDDMLKDTAITPALGRGYSIATNTYQSLCLVDVVGTEPSYNFAYDFREVTSEEVRTGAVARSTEYSGYSTVTDWSTQQTYKLDQEWKVKQTDTDKGGTKTYHHMVVSIFIDVYYHSVDEAKSKMSPAAVKILEGKDVPGFFDACGMYYVRSISRRAVVHSLFTYSTQTNKRDVAFDERIKTSIRRFDMGWDPRYTDSTSTSGSTTTGNMTTTTTATDLQISTKAFGLGKSQSTDLIAYDLDTFKASIKSAFKATQPYNVGMVTAIEVVPWIENTEFQSLNKLEPKTVPMWDERGFPVMDITDPSKPVQKTKVVYPYEQKRILSVNAEFLAEVDRAARAKLNAYYKAKMCRAQVNIDYMEMTPEGKMQFRNIPGGNVSSGTLMMGNNRKPGQANWIQLSALDAILSESSLFRIWMEYDAFMYGGTGKDVEGVETNPEQRAEVARAVLLGTQPDLGYPKNVFPGAGRCIADIFTAGISAESYRNLKTCQRIEESFATINGQRIDDYCMPKLANN
jgi:hypothetical protein